MGIKKKKGLLLNLIGILYSNYYCIILFKIKTLSNFFVKIKKKKN